jgi:hypothetical protein
VIVDVCQRWRSGRSTYRPAGETIDTRRHEVAEIADDTAAKAFVLEHHYEGSYPAAVARHGLYRDGVLVGVAVYAQVWPHVLASAEIQARTIELARLVLLDEVESNGESWFQARSRELLRRDGRAELVLSHSDDMPRAAVDGRVVHVGHIGMIYQAASAIYRGRAARNTIYLLPDGRVFSQRVQSKIRARDRGWRYGVDLLVERGAEPPSAAEDLRVWLTRWRAALCRRVRHPGNHRYLIPVTARARRWAPASLPYPKLDGPVRWRE